MLPGVRLIAAAFLCGFVLTLAGVRMLDLRTARDPLFMSSALAATAVQPRPSQLPAVFDARFAASPGAVVPLPASLIRSIDTPKADDKPPGVETMSVTEPPAEETASLNLPPAEPSLPAPSPEPAAAPEAVPDPARILAMPEANAAPALDVATAAEFDSGLVSKSAKRKDARPAKSAPKRLTRVARLNADDPFAVGRSRGRFVSGYPQH
jgi:hypothetical protein